jgi:hypothetical protein
MKWIARCRRVRRLQAELQRIVQQSPIDEAELLGYRTRLVAHAERTTAFAESIARGLSASNN